MKYFFYFCAVLISVGNFCFGQAISKKEFETLLKEAKIIEENVEILNGKLILDFGESEKDKLISAPKLQQLTILSENKEPIHIKTYPQTRYGKYVDSLNIPEAIMNGRSNEMSEMLISNQGLQDTWIISHINEIGAYCAGNHINGSGDVVGSGFYMFDKYGMCLQISCSEEIAKLEHLGVLLVKAIHEKLDLNFVKPSSLLNIKEFYPSPLLSDKSNKLDNLSEQISTESENKD